jgi:hypothetical protein
MFYCAVRLIAYIKRIFITVVESVYSAVRTDCYMKQVFITVEERVYSAVRTDCLYRAGICNRGGKCLQRGTDLLLILSRYL